MSRRSLPDLVRDLEEAPPRRRFLKWLVAILSIPTLLLSISTPSTHPWTRFFLLLHGGSIVSLVLTVVRQGLLRRTLARRLHLR